MDAIKTTHGGTQPRSWSAGSPYSQSRRHELGKLMSTRTKLYLDQKYWIYCRDAYRGRPQKPIHLSIWRRLVELTEARWIVCPSSFAVLIETQKRGDLALRTATATVVDQLSGGIALQPNDFLFELELSSLLCSMAYRTGAQPPEQEPAWTYAGWLMGEPAWTANETPRSPALHRAIYDFLSRLPFSTLVGQPVESQSRASAMEAEFCAHLNAQAELHRADFQTFEEAFAIELAGLLIERKGSLVRVLRHMFERHHGHPPLESEVSNSSVKHEFSNLIFWMMHKKKWSTELPCLHILPSIHAAMRHRRQPFRPGDVWDQLHAHSALAYCDAFFTERSLGSLVSSAPLNFHESYNCKVLWNDEEILKYLDQINQPATTDLTPGGI